MSHKTLPALDPGFQPVVPTGRDPVAAVKPPASPRFASVDAYRGFVMLLMMAEVVHANKVAKALPDSRFWAVLAKQQSHVDWLGCHLHDLIQPSFSFLVGVALPFSIASRRARGQSFARMSLHAWWRALLLILLGVALRSTGSTMTNWTFEDTLSQIGLGYGFLFLLGFRPVRDQWIALGVVLLGYFAAFALYPLPPADFDFSKVNVSQSWLEHTAPLTGFAQHWQKNCNFAWAFDTWWINLFPRPSTFGANNEGYSTLSFIPTLGTMLLGLIAGNRLREGKKPAEKIRWFVIAGVIGLTSGWLFGALGICPVVKKIWTPAWVLFSGGWCFLFLAGFYAVMELWQKRAWAYPLLVIGANSIAAYCIAHLFEDFISKNLLTHLGQNFFKFAGEAYEPFFHGIATLLVMWLILFWMYRRKIFLKI